MRQILAAAVFALALAAPAVAEEGAKPAPGQYVDIISTALPVVDGGKLRNYVFITARLSINPRVDAQAMKAKEPYFRDALVRTAHRTPFTVPGNWATLNQEALRNTIYRQAVAIAGPGVVTGVTITSITPQRSAGMAQHSGGAGIVP